MKKVLSNINWSELFFPIYHDLKNINEETDSKRVSMNNWSLASNDTDFDSVKTLIDKNRNSVSSKHDIIILE